MKETMTALSLTVALALTLCWVDPVAAQVTLEVLNPRGEITPPPVIGIRPRVTDLAGRKIALIDNTKAGARNFLDAVQEQLQRKYPTAVFLAPPKPEGRILQDTEEWYPEVVKQFDTFIFGVGD